MVYPLYLVNWEQPEHRDLIEKSLDHWMSLSRRPARLQLHRRRLDHRPDGPGRRRADVPEEVFDPSTRYRAGQHHVLRGRAGHRDTAVGRRRPCTTCSARAGAASSGSSRPCRPPGGTSRCTTSAPRARSWSARSARGGSDPVRPGPQPRGGAVALRHRHRRPCPPPSRTARRRTRDLGDGDIEHRPRPWPGGAGPPHGRQPRPRHRAGRHHAHPAPPGDCPRNAPRGGTPVHRPESRHGVGRG